MNFAKKNRSFGDRGEEIAMKFLVEKGLEFVDRNFYAQGGEIDLIMLDRVDDVYVFVEVKTRREGHFDSGFEAINSWKVKKILRAGRDFFFKKFGCGEFPNFRVDAVILEISDNGVRIEHLEHL